MEMQCEVDCEYLTYDFFLLALISSSFFFSFSFKLNYNFLFFFRNVAPEWTLAMDHELVKFINSVCDKIKKSSFHIR